MKYHTINELDHFTFEDVQLGDLEVTGGFFHLWMDNVGILDTCSANRDIRKMRCNGMLLRIEEGRILSFVEEGYTYLDADGKLMRQDPDVELAKEDYADRYKVFCGGWMVSIEKQPSEDGFVYTIVMDGTDEHTYCMTVAGKGDHEEWDRFLNL